MGEPTAPDPTPPTPDAPAHAGSSLTSWVAVLGSVVTIVLTVWNTYTKSKIDDASREIEARRTHIDESRERVERYKFALSTLTGLATKDLEDQQVALTMARLALTDAEAGNLFAGLLTSPDSGLSALARRGAAQTQAASIRDPDAATRSERQGYQHLVAGAFDSAAAAFEAAERAYPTYHHL